MPRYFFHLADGVREADDEGMELSDIRAASEQAIMFAGEIIKDHPQRFSSDRTLHIVVSDESGSVCFTVTIMVTGGPLGSLPTS
jgi:hypothetical protein